MKAWVPKSGKCLEVKMSLFAEAVKKLGALAGVRGVEKSLEMIKEKMAKFSGIYLTIDIDVLDPAYAPGTGTPQFGGLNSRELLDLLHGLFELPIIGFDVVEVAPALDDSRIALFAARKIIIECWGHYFKKIKGKV